MELLLLQPARRYQLAELTGGLRDPSPRLRSSSHPSRAASTELDRQLLAVLASTYVPALTGRQPNRAGKIHCPFHELSGRRRVTEGVSPAGGVADASVNDCGGSR